MSLHLDQCRGTLTSLLSGQVPTSPTHPTIKPPSNTGEMFTSMNPPFNTQTPLSVQVPTSPQHSTFSQATNTEGPWTLDPKSPTKTLLSLRPESQTKPSDTEQLVKKQTYGVVISGYDGRLSEVWYFFTVPCLTRVLSVVSGVEIEKKI